MLKNPKVGLERLFIRCNNLGDAEATIFASALKYNSKLKGLFLRDNDDITKWDAFTKLLCDTTSINKTFASNHTLQYFDRPRSLPKELVELLNWNKTVAREQDENGNVLTRVRSMFIMSQLSSDDNRDTKDQIALYKVFKYHTIDVDSLLEFEMKLLPFVIARIDKLARFPGDDRNDFEAARYYGIELNADGFRRRSKLNALYQFLRSVPCHVEAYRQPRRRIIDVIDSRWTAFLIEMCAIILWFMYSGELTLAYASVLCYALQCVMTARARWGLA